MHSLYICYRLRYAIWHCDNHNIYFIAIINPPAGDEIIPTSSLLIFAIYIQNVTIAHILPIRPTLLSEIHINRTQLISRRNYTPNNERYAPIQSPSKSSHITRPDSDSQRTWFVNTHVSVCDCVLSLTSYAASRLNPATNV